MKKSFYTKVFQCGESLGKVYVNLATGAIVYSDSDSKEASHEDLVMTQMDQKQEQETYLAYLQTCWDKDHKPRIVIAPTMACNLKCPYCYELGVRKKGCLSDNEINFIRGVIIAEDISDVILYGGEPLQAYTEETIYRLFASLKEVTFTAISNGLDLRLFKKYFGKQIKKCQITIDGLSESQNKRRPAIDSRRDTFTEVVEGISLALNAGVAIELRSNIDRNNEKEYQSLRQFLEGKFGGFNNFKVYSHAAFNVGENVQLEKNSFKPEIGVVPDNLKYFLDCIKYGQQFHPRWGYCATDCKGGQLIFAPGGIWNCWADVGNKKALNSTYDSESISELLPDKMRLKNGICSSCEFVGICGGGCLIREGQTISKELRCPFDRGEMLAAISDTILKRFGNEKGWRHLQLID